MGSYYHVLVDSHNIHGGYFGYTSSSIQILWLEVKVLLLYDCKIWFLALVSLHTQHCMFLRRTCSRVEAYVQGQPIDFFF